MTLMIPVATPYIAKNSQKYISDAVASGAVSGLFGGNIEKFEHRFASFVGVEHAVACTNGTVALHLSLAAYGVGPGDEVLVSSLTNMATFFAVLYCGATPVPIDVDIDTFNINVDQIRERINDRTKAILIVHLFGQPVDMDPVLALSKEFNLPIFEDCAESHGATYKGRQTGSMGKAGCFSFFANKVISTGEGGMVTTNDSALAERMRSLRSLAFGKVDKFLHSEVGYNYRMDNLKAALGRAQMDEADQIVAMKVRMGRVYDSLLTGQPKLILPVSRPNIQNVYWMYHLRLDGSLSHKRNEIMELLAAEGVETRPGFVSYTLQPFCDDVTSAKYPCPIAESVSYTTFYLPSAHEIEEATQARVAKTLTNILESF